MVSYLVQVELQSIIVAYFDDHINATGGLRQLCVLLTYPYSFGSSSLRSYITDSLSSGRLSWVSPGVSPPRVQSSFSEETKI